MGYCLCLDAPVGEPPPSPHATGTPWLPACPRMEAHTGERSAINAMGPPAGPLCDTSGESVPGVHTEEVAREVDRQYTVRDTYAAQIRTQTVAGSFAPLSP